MLTLILREIEDNRVHFIMAIILAVFFSVIIGYNLYYDQKVSEGPVTLLALGNGITGMWIFCSMGSYQMYSDRTKKISALLATLAVTRKKIFIARVASGILAVLAGLLPAIGTMAIAMSMTEPETPVYIGNVLGIWILILLFCFAGYCIGLLAGWSSNKITPTLGPFLLTPVMIGLIFIKGFELDLCFILVLLIIYCLLCAWRTYSTAAL